MASLLSLASLPGSPGIAPASAAALPRKPTLPFYQCPAIGEDTSCGTLIVINPDSTVSVYSDVTQGPYDGDDDTLVGIENDSPATLLALPLRSADLPIFDFDGDGLCTQSPGPAAGCPFGPNGYEGPNTTETANDPNSGTVTFGPVGLASGVSTYFSLEAKLTRFDILTPQTIMPTPPAPVATDQPQEPCVRAAIESTNDGGLTLFSISGQHHSSIEKDVRSDSLYNVTARSETGLGIEEVVGEEVKLGTLATVSDDLDASLHLNWADEQRTYWFSESAANQAMNSVNLWGSIGSSEKASWNSHLDETSHPWGFDVSGYGNETDTVDGEGVGANAGASGVVWFGAEYNPLLKETTNQGVLQLHAQAGGSEGPVGGLLSGDAFITVGYTVDAKHRPKALSLELVTAGGAALSLTGGGDDFFVGGFKAIAGSAQGQAGVVVESSVDLDLSTAGNATLATQLSRSLPQSGGFLKAVRAILDRTELRVAAFLDTGTSSEFEAKVGLDFTFGIQFGTSFTDKGLVAAAFAERGGGLQEWTQCEKGTTPFLAANE